MCKLIQITVERVERFQIAFKESSAVKFPEAAKFLQEGFAVGHVLPAVGDSEVDKFLHPFEGFLRIVATTFGEPFGGPVGLASDVGHCWGKVKESHAPF